MDTSAVAQLRDALVKLEKDPSAIHRDDMAFFRSYVEGFGGTIPPKPTVEDPAEEEGDLEPDLEGVVEPDDLPPQAMGEPGAEVSDEVLAQDAKGKAMEQLGAGNFEKAIDLFTQAIILNPGSAILHASVPRTSLTPPPHTQNLTPQAHRSALGGLPDPPPDAARPCWCVCQVVQAQRRHQGLQCRPGHQPRLRAGVQVPRDGARSPRQVGGRRKGPPRSLLPRLR
mmetsp:Transcript_28239/g.89926  ORF Transcript_28239/g.89926 Transcript_28239/m.89926 type:complete len:226 (-) Transcript_28239:562-1239(-)